MMIFILLFLQNYKKSQYLRQIFEFLDVFSGKKVNLHLKNLNDDLR